jgi:hypothetical protein
MPPLRSTVIFPLILEGEWVFPLIIHLTVSKIPTLVSMQRTYALAVATALMFLYHTRKIK